MRVLTRDQFLEAKSAQAKETKKRKHESRLGRKAWNKGLTKETSEVLRRRGEARRGYVVAEETKEKLRCVSHYKGPDHPNWGKHWSEEVKQRMREGHRRNPITPWNKGLTQATSELLRKVSQATRGPKHWNWKNGTSFEPYPAEFNRQLKELIRHRDGYQCQRCGCPEVENMKKLAVHHIDYDKNNCLPSNLISLCKRCSSLVNSDREFWEWYFKSILARRVPEGVTNASE